jgi:AraC-like DNA-binding protein
MNSNNFRTRSELPSLINVILIIKIKNPYLTGHISQLSMSLPAELYTRLLAAKVFMDENYHEPISLDEISKKAFLSRYHFHRLFSQVYRKTPHRYLTAKRMEKARDLLAENRKVTEVCNEVGFESLGSFSVLFKKEIGFAPQYYRNMAWLKKQKEKDQPRTAIPHCCIESYRI